jgi:putative flippase GtrA
LSLGLWHWKVAGTCIRIGLGLDNATTLLLAITLGFVFGFALSIKPLLKAEFTFKQAFKQMLIAEGASILVMEAAEALVEVYTPDVMSAGLSDAVFWMGMVLALGAGFVAAFPINYYLVRKGVRHQH